MTAVRCAVTLCFLVAALPAAVCGQEPSAPPPPLIDTIIVVTQDIFRPEEAQANGLFRVMNALHFTTRPTVVWHELLFKQGEPYDSARVAETERNLRARGLFRQVSIDSMTVGDRLIVLVETNDGWTTELVLNANFTGGEFNWALGGIERNFIGTGARVGVVYRDEPDRTALRLLGGMDRIRGTRAGVDGYYDNLSDGSFGGWTGGVPYRSFGDRWALELPGAAGNQRILQFRDGDSLQTYRRRLFWQSTGVSYAPIAGAGGYVRLGAVGQIKREEYMLWTADPSTVPDTVTGAVGVFVDAMKPRYMVVTHYNGFAREEDVDLSMRLTLGVWLAPDAWGYERTGIAPGFELQAGTSIGRHFAKIAASGHGLFTSAGLDSGQVRVTATAAARFYPRHSTVLHVQAGALKNAAPGSEFDLGSGFGPRAFPAHAFTGERMAFAILEHRAFLIDQLFGMLGLGFAGFLDYGGAWFADQPSRLGGDVGVGLRFGSTRSTAANVGRLDLAYRFGEGFEGNRWVVSFGQQFPF
ncbi:MAG: hypothetical protein JSW43_07415 [Gemmatimonadota bacterium]|nr:MAG: hypothetical protein JSW43_07415 [Gemmatimonadota bacterium]